MEKGQVLDTNKQAAVDISKISPTAKTPEQRKIELQALMAMAKTRKDSQVVPDMPQAVKDIISTIEGLSFSDLRPDTIPTSGEFKGYVSGKTGLPGWSAGDSFTGKILFAKDGYAVAVKMGVSVYEVRKA